MSLRYICNGLLRSSQSLVTKRNVYSSSLLLNRASITANTVSPYSTEASTTSKTTTTTNQKGITEVPYQFLAITEEQWDKGIGKDNIPKVLKDQFNMVGNRTTLLRPATFKVIEWLGRMKQQNFLKNSINDYCRVLDGRPGTGKTVTLAQIAFWANQQGWLVVKLPDANTFINGGILTKFEPNPLIFEHNDTIQPFLEQFVENNADKLKQIKLKTKFKIQETGFISSPDKTLFDLLETIKFEATSDIFYHFKKEINAVTEFPVLVAIDGYNYYLRTCEFGDMFDPASTPGTLPADRLIGPHLFKNITQHSLTNGVVVASLSNEKPKPEVYDTVPKSCFIEVEKFSLYELRLFINFLVESGYYPTAPATETIQYIYQMASGNPRECWKLLRIL
eukprot:gene1387-1753_t